MNRVARWVDNILAAGAWQGVAAAGERYEDWPARLAPLRTPAATPVLPCPPRSAPAEKPRKAERKSA